MDSETTKLIETARNMSDSCCRNLKEISLKFPSLNILCLANRNIILDKYRSLLKNIENGNIELAKQILSSMFTNSSEITLASIYTKDIKPLSDIVKILSGGIKHDEILTRIESYID